MKKAIRDLFLLSLLAGLASCASDDLFYDSVDDSAIKHITVTLPTIEVEEGVASTRNQFINMGTADWNAVWAEGDTLGIFPSSGSQVEFAVTEFGSNTSVFDGGGWALKSAVTYAAYYPFDKHNVYVTNKTIPLDYTGQVQQGNGSYDHLGGYDFLASKAMPRSGNSLNFELLRQGYVICLTLTVPATDTYTEIDLVTDGTLFVTKAELDISSTEAPVVTPKETSKVIRLGLEDVAVSKNGMLTAYMMAFPVGSVTPTVVLHGQNGTYSGVVQKVMNLTRNKMAIRPVTLAEYQGPAYIKFADAAVKAICVENWDTNGDGELDMAEAAAVTDLNVTTTRSGDGGSVFTGNREVTSFDELQYFTGITSIPANAFLGCEGLTSVTIPENVETIGEAAFKGCWNLEEITLLPTEVPTLEGDVSSIFISTNDCPILVPEESLDAYVSEWGLYADRIDPNLEVLTNLNLIAAAEASAGQEFKNKNADGTVVLDEVNRAIVEAVTTLNVSNKNDPNVCDEIGYFINLTTLDCKNNFRITTLDVSKNTALTSLKCGSNKISSLDVSKNTALETLECEGNLLTTLDVSKNSALKFLQCQGNQLTTLDLSKNSALRSLSIGDNKLSFLDVSNNEALSVLGCYNNLLAMLDVSKNTKLEFLFCQENQLSMLDLSRNASLNQLRCFSNKLSTLDISANVKLELSRIVDVGNQSGELVLYVNETQSHQTLSGSYNDNVVIKLKDSDSEIINFADDNVKSICVNNWDTNGDGELSMAEAAAVADIGDVFRAKDDGGAGVIRKIKSFDEFQYFTSVTEINNAFIGAESMTSIVLPRSLRKIGPSAFRICSSLESIELPDGLVEIGNMAFASCSSIQTIEIPESVMTIGTYAFSGCSLINSFNVPRNVTSIGHSVVSSCNALSTITVDPNNSVYDSRNSCNAIIEKATNTLIAGCKDTNIPSTVTRIGDYAFSNCSEYNKTLNLTNITAVGSQAFYGTNITGVLNIPVTLTVIGDRAFPTTIDGITVATGNPVYDSRENCNAIIETATNKMLVVCKANKGFIPSSVEILSGNLFYGMTGLDHVTIPSSVKTMGTNLFSSSDVKTVTIQEGTTALPDGMFLNCASLVSVEIPSTVTGIGSYVFTGSSIESLVLPENIKSIGYFMNCQTLNSLTILAKTPPTTIIPINSLFFNGTPCLIYVPSESLEAYKTAWGSYYENKLRAIE